MMKDFPPPPHKPLEWVGDSLNELKRLPVSVRRAMGYALRFAQAGVKPDHAKPLRGFKGAGTLEVIENFDGNTYRAVYTVKLKRAVYVLHCFQKKSTQGIATPQRIMVLIERRLKMAEIIDQEWNDQAET